MINKIARLIIHPFEIISMGIIEVVKLMRIYLNPPLLTSFFSIGLIFNGL